MLCTTYVQYTVRRNAEGEFGFSISGGDERGGQDSAVQVCRVDAASQARQVGLEVGDQLIAVDRVSVAHLPVHTVAGIIRSINQSINQSIGLLRNGSQVAK